MSVGKKIVASADKVSAREFDLCWHETMAAGERSSKSEAYLGAYRTEVERRLRVA